MRDLKSRVIRMMRQHPECRDNDVALAFAVWENEGLQLTSEQRESLVHLSKPGSVVRIRAHIQNVEQRFRPLNRRS